MGSSNFNVAFVHASLKHILDAICEAKPTDFDRAEIEKSGIGHMSSELDKGISPVSITFEVKTR